MKGSILTNILHYRKCFEPIISTRDGFARSESEVPCNDILSAHPQDIHSISIEIACSEYRLALPLL